MNWNDIKNTKYVVFKLDTSTFWYFTTKVKLGDTIFIDTAHFYIDENYLLYKSFKVDTVNLELNYPLMGCYLYDNVHYKLHSPAGDTGCSSLDTLYSFEKWDPCYKKFKESLTDFNRVWMRKI